MVDKIESASAISEPDGKILDVSTGAVKDITAQNIPAVAATVTVKDIEIVDEIKDLPFDKVVTDEIEDVVEIPQTVTEEIIEEVIAEEKIEVVPEVKAPVARVSKEEIEVQSRQKQLTEEIGGLDEFFKDEVEERPVVPTDTEDEAAMQVYNILDAQWQARFKRIELKKQKVREQKQAELRAEAFKTQEMFLKKHPELSGESRKAFEAFIGNNQILYAGWVTGIMRLDSLYRTWQEETGEEIVAKQPAPAPVAPKVVKPISVKTTASGHDAQSRQGKNGLPSKFVYANKPELANYVKSYTSGYISPIKGRALTHEEIEQLAETKFHRG